MKTMQLLSDLLEHYVEEHRGKGMVYSKVNGNWLGHTAAEVKELAFQMAASLNRLGIASHDFNIEKQDKIGIISNNRTEWIITDFAVQYSGAILVPIYPSITASEWEYIINEAQLSVLFISDKMLYRKLKLVLDNCASLKHVFSFDEIEGVRSWNELLHPYSQEEASAITETKNANKPDHLATIIYTSGTTGNPKGVLLTHQNIVSNVESSIDAFNFCDSDERVLSFLPLNHIFERLVMYLYIRKGVSIYFAEGMETIGPDLRDVKPVVF
jgi:long-chain acyl-CoA synthetase